MELDPEVRAVLDEARRLIDEGRAADALEVYVSALGERLARADHFGASNIAHMAGVVEPKPGAKLEWNRRALAEAEAVSDRGSVAEFYPSLYNNLAYSYSVLGNDDEARRCLRVAWSHIGSLKPRAYADRTMQAIRKRLAELGVDTTALAPMDGRRLELWHRMSSRLADLTAILNGLGPDQWTIRCDREGWSVGLVACHISVALRRQAGWIEWVLAGRRAHRFDWERSHALNALVARRATPERAETLRALGDAGERWHRLLSKMTEPDLDLIGFQQKERMMPVEWVAGTLVPRHIEEHARSVRQAIGLS